MKYYAFTKDGMLSDHRHLYTDPDAAQTEMETMQQAHGTAWPVRLNGAKVEEVHVSFVDEDSKNVQAMMTALQQIAAAATSIAKTMKSWGRMGRFEE